MTLEQIIYKILYDPMESAKLIVEIFILVLIFQFRVKEHSGVLKLPEHIVSKLIDEFEPEDLVDPFPPTVLLNKDYNIGLCDLCSYDAFELRNKFKSDLKATVNTYGVGTCGPPTFFGTLDIHKELEKTVADYLGTEQALLYSNYYACIQSVISCFCSAEDHVFYLSSANEGILRGLYYSKAKSFEFTTIESLKILLEVNFKKKVRNYVVVEGLSKNTGQIIPLNLILDLKKQHPFRIILDESCSIPLVNKKGICGFYNIDIREIEMIVGSFSGGFPSCGGFFAGDESICEYQKISSSSYVFSASLPAVFTKFNILALQEQFDYNLLRRNTFLFHENFKSDLFEVMSSLESPLIVLRLIHDGDKEVDEKVYGDKEEKVTRTDYGKLTTKDRDGKQESQANNKHFLNNHKSPPKDKPLLRRLYIIKHHLETNGVYVGVNKNPNPSLRIVMKVSLQEDEVINLTKMISSACNKEV